MRKDSCIELWTYEIFFGRCHTVLGRCHKSIGRERTPALTGESQLINSQSISIAKDSDGNPVNAAASIQARYEL